MRLNKLLEKIENVNVEFYKEDDKFYIEINNIRYTLDEFWNNLLKNPNSLESAIRDAFIEFANKYIDATRFKKTFSRDDIFKLFQMKFPKPDVKFKCDYSNGKFTFISLEDYDDEEVIVTRSKNMLSGENNKYYEE